MVAVEAHDGPQIDPLRAGGLTLPVQGAATDPGGVGGGHHGQGPAGPLGLPLGEQAQVGELGAHESDSLSRAARLNRVTQSAVSQQLRALEQRSGRRLVDRSPRVGARATEAGRLLYEEARAALARLAAVEQPLRAPDEVAGSVRVGTVYSVGLHTLPPAMKRFLRAHPR